MLVARNAAVHRRSSFVILGQCDTPRATRVSGVRPTPVLTLGARGRYLCYPCPTHVGPLRVPVDGSLWLRRPQGDGSPPETVGTCWLVSRGSRERATRPTSGRS